MKKQPLINFTLSTLFVLFSSALLSQLDTTFDYSKFREYKELYGVDCLHEKITNNRGDGFEALYGTRNFRTILYGVAYRGGANNYYHRTNKRYNKNPMPIDGLKNLLENGFSTSVYLYKDNFESAPKYILNKNKDTLNYYQLGGNDASQRDSILNFTYQAIMNKNVGPVYLHCWNGWHQSGYISAVLLKQFCGYNNDQSIEYWEKCADHVSKGYTRIRNSIKEFEVVEKYKIPKEISDSICPCSINKLSNDDLNKEQAINNTKSLNHTINYPYNEAEITPSVLAFLDEYAKLIKNDSTVLIEIGGHTDSKGSSEFNQKLSEKRAQKVMDYLISQGVDANQLKSKGYGENKLKNNCKDGVECSNQQHSENRRIEFKIIN